MPSELAAALAKVQAELPSIAKDKTGKVEGVSKNGRPFSYEYKYADLDDVSAAVLPLLGKHGLAFTAWPTLNDGQFVLAYALLHESGEERTGIYPLPSSGTPQQVGGVITYARRYTLCAVTGVAPGEDTDAAGATEIHMDRRRGPERYNGGDRPHDNTGRVSVPVPGPEHERLRHEPPPDSRWDGEDHWVDQPPTESGITPAAENRPRGGQGKLSPAQAIVVHFKRLGVTDDTERLVKTTVLAGRTELLEHTGDLDEATQRKISTELGKCRDRVALDALLDTRRTEVPS
jgi:hypothetical protein